MFLLLYDEYLIKCVVLRYCALKPYLVIEAQGPPDCTHILNLFRPKP